MSSMLLVTPGMHPVRGIAKASRHPRPLHVFQKSMDFKGTDTKGYTWIVASCFVVLASPFSDDM